MGIFKTTALVAALTIGTVGAASATDFGGVAGAFGGTASSTVVDAGGAAGVALTPGRTTVINRSGSWQESGAMAGLSVSRGSSVDFNYNPRKGQFGVTTTKSVAGAVDTGAYSRGETTVTNIKRGDGPAFGGAISLRGGFGHAAGGFLGGGVSSSFSGFNQ